MKKKKHWIVAALPYSQNRLIYIKYIIQGILQSSIINVLCSLRLSLILFVLYSLSTQPFSVVFRLFCEGYFLALNWKQEIVAIGVWRIFWVNILANYFLTEDIFQLQIAFLCIEWMQYADHVLWMSVPLFCSFFVLILSWRGIALGRWSISLLTA